MKWAFVIVYCCILNTSNVYTQHIIKQRVIFHEQGINQFNNFAKFIPVFLRTNYEYGTNSYLDYETIDDQVVVFLLLITTFLIVSTPVFLVISWAYFSYIYVKKYRPIYSVKKWVRKKNQLTEKHLQKQIWLPYRKVYSLMLGFGMAIIAYSFTSVHFMLTNFDKMETALASYFQFPLLVLDNFDLIDVNLATPMKMEELWNQMLLIVVASFVFFFIGFLAGTKLVDFRFKQISKKIKEKRIKVKAKKEMFYIKIKSKEAKMREMEAT